jgi:hypothetical protein
VKTRPPPDGPGGGRELGAKSSPASLPPRPRPVHPLDQPDRPIPAEPDLDLGFDSDLDLGGDAELRALFAQEDDRPRTRVYLAGRPPRSKTGGTSALSKSL